MKRATGELSNLVVVCICVAILIAFFYFTIWPIIKNNFVMQTSCEKAKCLPEPDQDGMVKCYLDGKEFLCNYKG